ncbi:hypothetical protein F7R91_35915 [Streptomyces luteolifulvus]|uniref:Lipoprotein n=1 Tax=Streptomyces luteolifulvus TaxID=2615112 RepID=A0A6H9UQ60_9ACTN|nr:hypothetical protein [Streptomyces luteolifulvus]KAB1140488.1 hypothetical protein F7R91_35915 [Streptomyces luteolifulvus]
MHRTTTTATLLVTVAATALCGCVTVHRPAAFGQPSAPSQPTAPRPDGRAGPQIVQAPAREALELIGPSRRPKATAPGAARPAPVPPAAQERPAPRRHPNPRPPHPESRRPQLRAEIPDKTGTRESPRGTSRQQSDVCALGRKYGGWRPGSPEAVICAQTYGR